MAGVTSEPISEDLARRLADAGAIENPAPAVTSNPDFIEDDLGAGHSRATREVARFSTFAATLVKTADPAIPDQAVVKVPQLVFEKRKTGDPSIDAEAAYTDTIKGDDWQVKEHVITGAITLKVERASKFRGKADVNEPSRKLADFMRGEGEAWEKFRDDDMPALLLAWASAVHPTPADARRASEALAIAMCARAGLAVASTSHLPF